MDISLSYISFTGFPSKNKKKKERDRMHSEIVFPDTLRRMRSDIFSFGLVCHADSVIVAS
jgi:hypothetical protein